MITANSWSRTESNLTQLKYKEPGRIYHVNASLAHEPEAEAEFQHERACQAGEYCWTYAVRRPCWRQQFELDQRHHVQPHFINYTFLITNQQEISEEICFLV